ncbi:MAG: branched-chain amino acid transport system permease protein [Burkholderiales bacterium]|jgi:branched-chain amino acid transport system permease protein
MKPNTTLNPTRAEAQAAGRLALRIGWRWPALFACVVAMGIAPWWIGIANMRLCVELFALIAIAQMWNLLAGYVGIVAVGPQAFIGIGAYALFWSSNHFALNPYAVLPLAGLVAAATAIVFAPLLFRLRGPYFAIGTWVLAEMFRIGVTNADWLGAGAGINLEMIGTMDRWTRSAAGYWCALGVALLATGLLVALLRSPVGVALTAIRDDESAAESLGVNVERLKRMLFVCAAAIMGMAGGAVYVSVLQVNPDAVFSPNWAAFIIFAVIIGGLGTVEGPIIGALLFFALRETLSDYGAWYLISLGGFAIVIMLAAPRGLWNLARNRFGWNFFDMRRKIAADSIAVKVMR